MASRSPLIPSFRRYPTHLHTARTLYTQPSHLPVPVGRHPGLCLLVTAPSAQPSGLIAVACWVASGSPLIPSFRRYPTHLRTTCMLYTQPSRLPIPVGRHPGLCLLVRAPSAHHNAPQHTTSQQNTTQHNTTQHNTTQHNTTQHNTTQHNTTQHNTTQQNARQQTTPHHITPQRNTTQHTTTKHTTTHRTTPQHTAPHHNTPHHTTPQRNPEEQEEAVAGAPELPPS